MILLKRANDVLKKANVKEYLPIFYGFFIVIGIFVIYWISFGIHKSLPNLVKSGNEENGKFIGENSRTHLKALTDMGPKVVGGEANEVLAVQYLKNQIENIILHANYSQDIELSHQIVSGYYYLDYKPFGSYNNYNELQNIVVKVAGSKDSTSSVLVNAHFDSVPASPGGSDDGIMIATMLEILRVMSLSDVRPANSVIFLFNGAEEVGLIASHGFITEHRWKGECKVVVNLEATGAGGKEVLFQMGPGNSWLMEYYADVPHPHGHATGEELFQSGFVPSDTDFRIFRDFGGLIGFDFAFYEDGYRYHTEYDSFENIDLGSFQHTGDNILKLVQNIANDKDLGNKLADKTDKKLVYYDFIGLFFINYNKTSEIVLNVMTILLSIASAGWCFYSININLGWKDSVKYLVYSLGLILLGWLLAVAFSIILGAILDAANRTMTWYANIGIIFGLYCIPTICISFIPITLARWLFKRNTKYYDNFSKALQAQCVCHIIRLVLTFILFIGTCVSLRSVYVLIPYILLTTIGFIIVQAARQEEKNIVWIPVYIIALILPTLFACYNAVVTVSLFVPIMGRSGSESNPEFITGALATLLTIVITCTCAPLLIFGKKHRIFYALLSGIFVIVIIIIATPAAFPYSGDAENPKAQRYWIFHHQRVMHDENQEIVKSDAGYTFNAYDRNSPHILDDDVTEMKDIVSLADDCDTYLFCGLPTTNSRNIKNIESTIWIPTDQNPELPSPTSLEVLEKTVPVNKAIKYKLKLNGPDRMNIYISPKPGVEIVNIDLFQETMDEGVGWNDRSVYYILYTSAVTYVEFAFDIELSGVPPNGEGTQYFDIAVVGKYVHDELNTKTDTYKKFLSSFPKWTTLTPWLSYYESWVL